MDDRDELTRVLEGLLEKVVDDPADAHILKRAVSALYRLDYGEVDPLLAPSKNGNWGVAPGKKVEIQARAVGLVLILNSMGEGIVDAEKQIADAMGIDAQRLHKWRTQFNNHAVPHLVALVASQSKNATHLEKLGVVLDKPEILKNAQSLGEQLIKALQKKSKPSTGKN